MFWRMLAKAAKGCGFGEDENDGYRGSGNLFTFCKCVDTILLCIEMALVRDRWACGESFEFFEQKFFANGSLVLL